MFVLISILEIAAVTALIIGFCFEDKVIAFEESVTERFKRK